MGCNCGKSTPPPTSPPPPPDPAQKTSVVPGASTFVQNFAYIPPSGRRQTYGSKLEAEAARVRAGGVGSITRI